MYMKDFPAENKWIEIHIYTEEQMDSFHEENSTTVHEEQRNEEQMLVHSSTDNK